MFARIDFVPALTFVSVLRLIAAHFPGRQYAVVTSFTAAIGYVGNLAATVPLALEEPTDVALLAGGRVRLLAPFAESRRLWLALLDVGGGAGDYSKYV